MLMLDAPGSNTDDFLLRDTCVSSTELNKPTWNIINLSHLEKYDLEEEFLSKPNSILTGTQCTMYCNF
jgi:hypothetical protein